MSASPPRSTGSPAASRARNTAARRRRVAGTPAPAASAPKSPHRPRPAGHRRTNLHRHAKGPNGAAGPTGGDPPRRRGESILGQVQQAGRDRGEPSVAVGFERPQSPADPGRASRGAARAGPAAVARMGSAATERIDMPAGDGGPAKLAACLDCRRTGAVVAGFVVERRGHGTGEVGRGRGRGGVGHDQAWGSRRPWPGAALGRRRSPHTPRLGRAGRRGRPTADACRRSEPDRRDRTPQPDRWSASSADRPSRTTTTRTDGRDRREFAERRHGRLKSAAWLVAPPTRTVAMIGPASRSASASEAGTGASPRAEPAAANTDAGTPTPTTRTWSAVATRRANATSRAVSVGTSTAAASAVKAAAVRVQRRRRIDPYREQTDQPRDPLPAKLLSQVKDVGAVGTAVHSVGVTNQDGVDAVLGKHPSRAAVVGELVHAGTDDNLGRVVQTGPADRADHDRTLSGQGADEVPCVLGESVPTWRIRRHDSHPQRPPSQRVSPRLRPILALARRRRDRT